MWTRTSEGRTTSRRIGSRLVPEGSQQKKNGIHRKDLMAVPAAIPASRPMATVPISSSKGSLWSSSCCWAPAGEEDRKG